MEKVDFLLNVSNWNFLFVIYQIKRQHQQNQEKIL